tara:strand:+ start:185 stop:700 length:516 start_codon:yes stop_codon:yes gene_type:complete
MKYAQFILIIAFLFTSSCGGFKKVDQRQIPDGAKAKARKNINEGRGAGISNILKGARGTNFEFSSSNPMWRASLETLDFLPLTTVDYSGGMIISDWYTDQSSAKDAIKISIRFLGNDIKSENLKIIVHKKTCIQNQSCSVTLMNNTKIKEELHVSILKKAALLEKKSKEKK